MRSKLLWLTLIALLSMIRGSFSQAEEHTPSPIDVFEQRIMPIFASPNPSSCVQCHLSAVDLKDYILSSSEATFQSLRANGLINIESPESSKILTLITMGEQDLDKGAQLIHAKTRQAEYKAFAAWISACCNDPVLLNSTAAGQASPIGPTTSLSVVRYNRKDRLLDSFVRNIWSQRMRCFPCHTPNELDPANPKHEEPQKRHADLVKQYGQKMNLFRGTPQETLKVWITGSRKPQKGHLPLLNIENPAQSLVVLKPTSKLPAKAADGTFEAPSFARPVTHMGGLKMHVNDQSYKSFVAWIEDFAKVTRGEYGSEGDLPPDNWYPTEHVLRIKDTPADWPSMSTAQMLVYAWNEKASNWHSSPIAFTQSLVTPRRMLNGSLFLLADADQKKSWDSTVMKLTPGKYLIRVCIDRENKLADNPSLLLEASSSSAQAEINATWNEGFQQAEVVEGSLFK